MHTTTSGSKGEETRNLKTNIFRKNMTNIHKYLFL